MENLEQAREILQEQITYYADQICRGTVIDSAIDALFAAIKDEMRCIEVPEEIYSEVFDYINESFHIS